MLIIKNDGTVYPLDLKLLQDSQMELLAPVREWTEEITGADGGVDFGSELETGKMELRCVSPEGLARDEKRLFRQDLAARLDILRDGDLLAWESDPGRSLQVWLEGRPEI